MSSSRKDRFIRRGFMIAHSYNPLLAAVALLNYRRGRMTRTGRRQR